jgi:hypothetical protein
MYVRLRYTYKIKNLNKERKKIMAEIKYTQKQMYEEVIKMASGEPTSIPMDKVIEFAEKKLEQLANKGGKSSAKKNDEHEAFFEVIRDILSECSDVRGMRCGAIAKDSRAVEFEWADKKETSPQRVSAMLTKMVDKGDVVKMTDKKETYFRLA